jgi:pimeloyl-ACP methyl ester carboxylesterase
VANGYQERRVSAEDGLALFCRDYGDPLSPHTPILCLSGLTRHSGDYEILAPNLAQSRRVLALDYRGRGRSAWSQDWRHYSYRADLSDIRHVLTALNLHRVIVIGTSYGGLLAMAMGVLMPAAIRGVVINDVSPDLNADGQARIMAFIKTDRPQPDWESARRFLQATLPHLPLKTETDWQIFTRNTYREGADGLLHFDWDVRLARQLERHREEVDLWGLFGSLRRVPVLAVRGALSDLVLPSALERMAAAHPGLVPVTVAGVGHAPALTEPECAAALDRFLSPL